jgi:chitin-binding protein
MVAGSQLFTWNISWGPHFSDTQEFKYWITKSDFVYQVGRPLSFNDFEEQPFCSLAYDDANPNANPNVIPNPAAATFQTRCTVPQRSGHHIIYAEWGRNFFTFERFHGCIDGVFQGTGGPTVDAQIALTPNVSEFTGTGSITLDGRGSTGSNLSYAWSVTSQNPSLYSITNSTQSVATLNLSDPQASGTITVLLVVSGGGASDSATRTIIHRPSVATQWFDLGPVTAESRTLAVGDQVSIRTVTTSGQDAFWPTTPLTITAANTAADMWPLALAQAVNAANGVVRIGVLNAQNQVVPAQNATSNRVYAMTSASIASAFLQYVAAPPPGNGGVTVTPFVATSGPWFNEQQVRISNTAPITALSVTVVIQRTTGISHSGQYNTVGGSVTQTNSSTTSAITYQFTLGSGQTLSTGTNRLFAVQLGGTGTAHPTSGDTYTVTYTTGGVTRTQSGTF